VFTGGNRVKDIAQKENENRMTGNDTLTPVESIKPNIKEIPPFTFDFIWDTERIMPKTDVGDRNKFFLGANIAKLDDSEKGSLRIKNNDVKSGINRENIEKLNQIQRNERAGSAKPPKQEILKRETTKTRKALNTENFEAND
jgi:hypothetical protein